MWTHPATQSNLKTVISFNISVINPISKRLMCGDVGEGAMEEPKNIASYVEQLVLDTERAKNATLLDQVSNWTPVIVGVLSSVVIIMQILREK